MTTMQLDTAVSSLRQSAQTRQAGERIEQRLEDVQEFLAKDLEEVEVVLQSVAESEIPPANLAANHLVQLGGKRVRPLCLLLAARCFGEIRPEMIDLAAVVELVHSATLLHDDVVDEGMERRGAPCARRIHGNGVSVLAGDLLLISAIDKTHQLAPALVGPLLSTVRQLVEGEVIQMKGRSELDVSRETYFRILRDKTASLFVYSARAGAFLGNASTQAQDALAEFGEKLGIAFQLVDDVLDYQGDQSGKTLFADLTEGKLTLPLVLAIEKDQSLSELVAQIHAGDESAVAKVSAAVIDSGSCEEVRKLALRYTAEAERALLSLPESGAREFLRVVAQEMTARVS